MQHSEYIVVVPAATAVRVCGDSPTRSSLRLKNIGAVDLWIGNGMGVRATNGYPLGAVIAACFQAELALHLPWGDDTTQSYYAYNASAMTAGSIAVMEHCCPKIHLPSELEGPIT